MLRTRKYGILNYFHEVKKLPRDIQILIMIHEVTGLQEILQHETTMAMVNIPVSYTHLDVYKRQLPDSSYSRRVPSVHSDCGRD